MAYSKTTWATGDVIDAAKLNKIEDGIAANDTAIAGLAPYAVEGEIGVDGDENITVTLTGVKASDLYAESLKGRALKLSLTIGENHTSEGVVTFCSAEDNNNDTKTYLFRIVTVDGSAYSVTGLAATDTVVLTAES